jgi:hypothetical protein
VACEGDNSPPFSAKVKNETVPPLLLYACMACTGTTLPPVNSVPSSPASEKEEQWGRGLVKQSKYLVDDSHLISLLIYALKKLQF